MPDRRWAAGEGAGAVQNRLPDHAFEFQCPTVADRRGQARAQRMQLVVEPLLGDLALGDQATAVPDPRRPVHHRPGP